MKLTTPKILIGFIIAMVTLTVLAATYQNKFTANANPEGIPWTNTTTIGVRSSGTTNGNLFMGYGGIQISPYVYGNTLNYAGGGIQWMPNGWNGDPNSTNTSGFSGAYIKTFYDWGGNNHNDYTMHIASEDNIRIESGFGLHFATNYLAIGNEDANSKISINYAHYSFLYSYLYPTNLTDVDGYGLPLTFEAYGTRGGAIYSSAPGIMSHASGTNSGAPNGYWKPYLGELSFYSRVPQPDGNNFTYGQQNPAFTAEVGRMLTNGWKFFGKTLKEVTPVVVSGVSPSIVIDFNLPDQSIILNSSGTNVFSVTNLNEYGAGGWTNSQQVLTRISAYASDKYLSWPTNWTWVKGGISKSPPDFLSATKQFVLKLQFFGKTAYESNIVASVEREDPTASEVVPFTGVLTGNGGGLSNVQSMAVTSGYNTKVQTNTTAGTGNIVYTVLDGGERVIQPSSLSLYQMSYLMHTFGPAPWYEPVCYSAGTNASQMMWAVPFGATNAVVRYKVHSAYAGDVYWYSQNEAQWDGPAGRIQPGWSSGNNTNVNIICNSGAQTWVTNYIEWPYTNTVVYAMIYWNPSTNISTRYLDGPIYATYKFR